MKPQAYPAEGSGWDAKVWRLLHDLADLFNTDALGNFSQSNLKDC